MLSPGILSHYSKIFFNKLNITGRVVLIKHGSEMNKPAVLLSVDKTGKEKSYKVLTLYDDTENKKSEVLLDKQEEKLQQYLALAPVNPEVKLLTNEHKARRKLVKNTFFFHITP